MGSRRDSFISQTYGIPFVDLDQFDIHPEIIAIFSSELARQNRAIPINRAGATLIVAMADPSDIAAIDRLTQATYLNIEVVATSDDALSTALSKYYSAN